MTSTPPFPKRPSRKDWRRAAALIGERLADGWYSTSLLHSDPLGALAAVARDVMRTRHCNTPRYRAVLRETEQKRKAAEDAAHAARVRSEAARTAKERAEEDAFHDNGGTAIEWAIQQEATAQAKADATRKRATSRTRAKARSIPTRKRTTALAPIT